MKTLWPLISQVGGENLEAEDEELCLTGMISNVWNRDARVQVCLKVEHVINRVNVRKQARNRETLMRGVTQLTDLRADQSLARTAA